MELFPKVFQSYSFIRYAEVKYIAMINSNFDSKSKESQRSYSEEGTNQGFTYHMKYLWVIEKFASKSLFYHEFANDHPLDGILLSGLLSALNNFSEAELGDTGIESIEMGGLRWVYLSNSETNLMLVAAGEKGANANLIKARLNVIHNMFVQHFQIDKEFWDKWDYEITQFYNFSEILEMLRQQWSQADQMMNVGALFDLMGIFQQIFCIFIKIVNENFAGFKLHSVLERLNTYEKRLDTWYSQQNLSDSYRVMELFIPQIDLVTDEIIFNEAPATNIFGLNPIGLNQDVLIPLFYIVLRHFQNVIQSELNESLYLTIVKREIMPYIMHKWEFLTEMNLNKVLLQLFFAD